MKQGRIKEVFIDVLKKNKTGMFITAFESLMFLVIFLLYGELTEAYIYALLVVAVVYLAAIIVQFVIELRKAEKREHAMAAALTEWNNMPAADRLAEEDYITIIKTLGANCDRLISAYEQEKRDSEDYYTAWVHQIKTPISVMRLKLTAEDSAENRELLNELFRVEQYVDMALQYVRLDVGTKDLLIREYELDEIIKTSIRKYASLFVQKKLRLEYEETDRKIVTDKKWFGVILDQLLSNAIKYTQTGTVKIYVLNGELVVEDSGIGIAAEDLPRIFEKGFTGNNGRIDKKSSGLGLYLLKKASDMLCLQVRAESIQGSGSKFFICINSEENKPPV